MTTLNFLYGKTRRLHDPLLRVGGRERLHPSPPHLTLWEAFYGDGTSGAHLTELGFDVIHEDVDFFTHDVGDCVVTNPPFSELPRVLARLRELGKPFVVIMPTLTTRYFRDLLQDIQVIVPRKRIQFRKMVDGVEVPAGRCIFDCLYFCWRLGLPKDVVFLNKDVIRRK
jgi:hypothetical protein